MLESAHSFFWKPAPTSTCNSSMRSVRTFRIRPPDSGKPAKFASASDEKLFRLPITSGLRSCYEGAALHAPGKARIKAEGIGGQALLMKSRPAVMFRVERNDARKAAWTPSKRRWRPAWYGRSFTMGLMKLYVGKNAVNGLYFYPKPVQEQVTNAEAAFSGGRKPVRWYRHRPAVGGHN